MTSTIATAALLGTKRLLLVKSTASADADLLKATIAKTIIVPAYTRKDGVHVPAHTKVVHYDPSKDHADVLSGKGSHSQKQAHKKLSKLGHWESLDEQHKLAHILSSATNIQQKASASAAVSGWKAAMAAGKLPSAAQQAAFAALPKDKQDALLAEVSPAKAAAPAPSPYQLVGDVGFSNEGPVSTVYGDYAKIEELFGLPAGALAHDDSTTYTVKNAAGQTFSVYKHGGALSVRTSGGNNDHSSVAALVSHLEEGATGLSDALKDPAAAKLHAGMNKPGSWYANMTGDDKAKWLSENSGAAAAAIAADKKAEPVAPGISLSTPVPEKQKKVLDGWAAAGEKFALETMIDNNKISNPHIAAYAEKLLAGLPKIGAAIHSFANEKEGIASSVIYAGSGKYNVVLKDTDSGEFLPSAKQFGNEADAVAHAKKLAGIKNLEGKSAYEHMANSGTSVSNPLVPSAKEWLAANPGKEAELSSALVDLGMLSVAQLLGIYKPPGFGAGQSHGPDAAGAKPAVSKGDVFSLSSQYEKMNAGQWVVYNVSPDGEQVYMHKVGAKVPNQSNSATIPAATLQAAVAKGTAKKLADETGPKEGDTKPGADGGTLVLKNGHWVKQDEPAGSTISGYKVTEDVNAIQMVHATTGDDVVASIKQSGFNLSNNSMYGKGVYFSDKDLSQSGGKYKTSLQVKLKPHKQLVLDSDLEVAPALQKITGLSSGHLGSDKAREAFLAAGIGSLRFPVDGETYTVVLDPALIELPKAKVGPVGQALAAAVNPKLAQIPWDAQLLPDSNSNAKSHNGQVAKIKAMAEAGDVAGLQAYVDAKASAKQTYAKKQHLLASTALAALKEGGAPAAEAKAPAAATQAAPVQAKVPAAIKKLQSIDPAAVSEWLASEPGKMSNFAMSIFGSATAPSQKKFLKWASAASSNNGHAQHWKDVYKSAAISSLYGQHDKALIAGVGFVPVKDVTVVQAPDVLMDPGVIQAAAITAAAGGTAAPAANPTSTVAPDPEPAKAARLPASQKKLIDDIATWPDAKHHLADIVSGGNPVAAAYAQQLLDAKKATVSVDKPKPPTGIEEHSEAGAYLADALYGLNYNDLPTLQDVITVLQNGKFGNDEHKVLQFAKDAYKYLAGAPTGSREKSAPAPKAPPTVTPLQEEALVNAIKINGGTMPGAGTGVGYYAAIWDSLTPGQQEYLTEKAAAKPAAQLDPPPADLVPLMEAVNSAGPTSVAKKAAIRYLEAFPNSQLAVNQVHDALYNAGYIGLATAFAKDGKPGLESASTAASEPLVIPAPLLHNTQDGHSKFWSVSVHGKELTTVYGKIGTKGQVSKKLFDSSHDAKMAAEGAIKSKIKGGYHNTGKSMPHEYPAEVGPKEGDTKQGADGMLVLKNGHWVKVPGQDSAAWSLTEKDPSFSGVNTLTAELDGSAIYVAYDPDSATFEAGIMDVEGGEPDSDHFTHPKEVLDYLAKKFGASLEMPSLGQVEKLAGKVSGETYSPKVPKPAAFAPSSGYEAMDGWKQTGPQGGSNPGGRYRDEHGNEWYCKFPADEDIAKSEVLAAKLYGALGISGQDCKLVTKGGKVGIASRWIAVNKTTAAQLAKLDGTASGFGADAWLGNWDVVGLGYDNLQVGPDGKAHRVDAGGSLMYRAQGGKKQFGATVLEIDSLRDSAINPQAAAVFGKMTQADISASVAKVLALPDQSIVSLVNQYGPGDEASKQALAHTLLARKADLAAKFPKAMKAPKKVLDPSNLPVKPSDLPKPHDFENWNGPGQGLSSKAHVNKTNAAIEYQILGVAQMGNLPKLQAFEYAQIDKETGQPNGKMLPIANHPSKHVAQYHSDLVQILEEIANPPEPLKIFQETDVGTLEQLAASLPPKKFGTTVDSVNSNEKLGFWVVLGVAPSALKFKPAHALDYSKAAIAGGYAKFAQGSKLAKHFINSVQASGSYNDLFRNGKATDHSGNKLSDVAKAALDHASSQPEGTTIYRWQKMTDAMVSKVMAAQDGTVFQATGPMCTSYSPTATQHFGKHRVTIRYAKGAKAVDSYGSGGFKSEKEVTTLPNARFVILKKEMVPDTNHGGQRLELELLMLPPDLGL